MDFHGEWRPERAARHEHVHTASEQKRFTLETGCVAREQARDNKAIVGKPASSVAGA